ncbi:MAG: RnfH family protein [Burkholderiales bacterium]
MNAGAPDGLVVIEVCRLEAGRLQHSTLHLPPGCTVSDVLSSVLTQADFMAVKALDTLSAAQWAQAPLTAAIFGQRARTGDRLQDHDRIELLPGLQVDPKVARQRRAEHRRRQKGERRWSPDRRIESV